jgi:4-amino-4-deoxy-L-arabinose transferase-like glycosyltransferase
MFGIRFCPPVISAAMGLLMLRFVAREAGARTGFIMLLLANTTPLLAAGSILMTIDPPLVLFWSGAMVCAWRGLQPDGRTWHWLATGVWLGLAFLSKYTALLFIPSLALFFVLYPPARAQFRRAGPWLMFAPLLLAALPVVLWNAQHGWVTVQHVSENAKLDKPWHFTFKFFFEFLGAEAGLLNPIFFVAILLAVVGFWKSRRETALLTFLFAMGAPVFFGYWLYTLHSRVQPNWIAAGAIPLLCFALLYWEGRWRAGTQAAPRWLAAGLLLGAVVVIVLHDTSIVRRVTGVGLPVAVDPLRRVRGITDIAKLVDETRRTWQEKENRPTFIIASHYGLTGQLSFYLPEAKRGLPGAPLVFVRSSRVPKNQFYFWPEYRYPVTRRGEDAIYVSFNDKPEPAPAELTAQFDSISDLGLREIKVNGQVYHRLQLYVCRNAHERKP